ncbi:MAG: coiled-coil domain-containing protein, partial [Promethearchaeota archaeon]
MGIFPENPCEFAVDFIRKMRRHRDIVQIPSSRQVLSIPKLLLSRYYRKGVVTVNDYIEISAVTSFPDNQEIAKDIAFQILFPNYKKDMIDSFFQEDDNLEGEFGEKLDDSDILTELDKLQEMIDEIEATKLLDTNKIQKLEEFLDELNAKREEEPYKSALNFFNDDSELYKEEISSLEELILEAQKRLEQKINSLSPEDLKAGSNLGLNDLIQQESLREWEKLASKALTDQNILEDLTKLINANKLDDLLKSIKFIGETSDNQNILEQIKQVKNQLQNQINNLDQLFNAAKTLGETPKFDKDKILNNSLNQSSFEHNFNLADS